MFFDDDAPNIIYMIIWILISAFTLLYFFPTVVFSYVLDTSIQMMKRRDYIEIVNKEQKHLRALRSMRMYQVFKLIRRELIDFFNKDTGKIKKILLNHFDFLIKFVFFNAPYHLIDCFCFTIKQFFNKFRNKKQ